MRKVLVCAAALLCLGGCAYLNQVAANQAARDDTKCRGYGSQPGDPAYVQCRAQLDAARTQARATEGGGIPLPWDP